VLELAVDLTTALGAALAPATSATKRVIASSTGAAAAVPVFQMAALPAIVEPATYANAQGNLNPNGSYVALRALRDLVDPVPLFSRTYQAGPQSTEGVWTVLLAGASAASAFSNSVLGNARKSFANAALPPLDGTPGEWRAVYASPPTWTDLANAAAFRTVTVDLTGTAGGPTATRLKTIGGESVVLEWTTVDSNGDTTTTPIAGGTSLESITLEIRQVTLQRSWLDVGVLSPGIAIDGQDPGFVSSGDADDNDGMLPLLPSAFWLVRSATLNGTLAPADQRVLAAAGDETHVTLGGIAIAGPAADATVTGAAALTGQVIAWTSTLLPHWPA
jgi:hypothetical protein